jgi:hypothetical protein
VTASRRIEVISSIYVATAGKNRKSPSTRPGMRRNACRCEFVTILAGNCYSPARRFLHKLDLPEGEQENAGGINQPLGIEMKRRNRWKSGNRLDSIMNVLLIVLALGVLGVGAIEMEANVTRGASSAQQRV